jgi:hypothetical protein
MRQALLVVLLFVVPPFLLREQKVGNVQWTVRCVPIVRPFSDAVRWHASVPMDQ